VKRHGQEFVLIVLGVLVALFGESLVEGLREARLAEQYRTEMAADLTRDVAGLERVLSVYDGILDSGRRTAAWLRGGDAPGTPSQTLA